MNNSPNVVKKFEVDKLSIYICEDKYLLAQAAANRAQEYINKAVKEKGQAVIILSTGVSQSEFLDTLVERDIDWKKVVAFHLDEYVGVSENHPASFRRYLRERVIDRAGIRTYYFVEGDREELETECERLGKRLAKHTVDVAFIGIGENGHIAFNDPPARFDNQVKFKVVELGEACKKQQVREGWFKTVDDVPKRAITMTIPAIMESKTIISVVPDLRKAEAVKRALTWKISPEIPASILRRHPGATLFLDRYSASLFENSCEL